MSLTPKILSLIFVLISVTSYSQKDELLDMAMKHFGEENQTKTWWLKDFTGYLDYAHEVRMVIATDNEIYKGAYELKSSGLRFYIDGHLEDEEIHFVETDVNGRTTGYIYGQLNEDKFYCTWSDIKNIEQLDLYLYDNHTSKSIDTYLGWIEFYKSVSNNTIANNFTLQYKEGNYSLDFNGSKILLECNDDVCSTLSNISAYGENDEKILLDRVHKTLSVSNTINENKINLNLSNRIKFTTQSFIDFDERVSATFPQSDNQKFNNWSQLFFQSLFNKETFEDITKSKNDAISERCKNQFIGDIIIDIASDSIISGLYFIQSSAKSTVAETPFCYDFKKNKVIEISETITFDERVKSVIKDKVKERKSDFDTSSKVEYNIYTFCESGLKCRTPFSTINGRDEIIIPFAELKPYINKKGILAKYGNK